MAIKMTKPKPKPPSPDIIHVRVPEALRDWILIQAERENRNLSNMVVQLLNEARNGRASNASA
jgi:hypothetical protein